MNIFTFDLISCFFFLDLDFSSGHVFFFFSSLVRAQFRWSRSSEWEKCQKKQKHFLFHNRQVFKTASTKFHDATVADSTSSRFTIFSTDILNILSANAHTQRRQSSPPPAWTTPPDFTVQKMKNSIKVLRVHYAVLCYLTV